MFEPFLIGVACFVFYAFGRWLGAKSPRHRHVWKIKEKVEHPSGMEQLREAGITHFEGFQQENFARDVIVTYQCDCGAEKVERV